MATCHREEFQFISGMSGRQTAPANLSKLNFVDLTQGMNIELKV